MVDRSADRISAHEQGGSWECGCPRVVEQMRVPSMSPARFVSNHSASTRVDRATGIEEHARFLGPPGERIFSILALPAGEVRGGVVIAPSLLTDRIRLYRDEVSVARRLAARGLAVLRFDYRGFGHSDGQTGVADQETMLEDLAVAVQDLENHVDGAAISLVGSRFGSALIAQSLQLTQHSVLWYPVLSGHEYFRLAFRGHMVGSMHREGGEATPTRQLTESGYANVLGYRVSRRLVEGASAAALVSEKWKVSSRVLWIEAGTDLSAPRQEAADRIRESGAELVVAFAPTEDPGWFVGVRPFQNPAATDRLVEWLTEGAVAT